MINDKVQSIMALVFEYADAHNRLCIADRDGIPAAAREHAKTMAALESAIREAIAAPGVAQGWVIVPVEPTNEMLECAMKECGGMGRGSCGEHTGIDWDDLRSVYAEMLAAGGKT